MFEMLTNFRWLLDLLDILLVAFIIYRILILIQGTRAVQMLVGLAVLLIVFVASQIGGLYTLNWILNFSKRSSFILPAPTPKNGLLKNSSSSNDINAALPVANSSFSLPAAS